MPLPVRALIRLDFPTFERPIIAIFGVASARIGSVPANEPMNFTDVVCIA
jgi:hypothetical protein